jgi:hypothetical protein
LLYEEVDLRFSPSISPSISRLEATTSHIAPSTDSSIQLSDQTQTYLLQLLAQQQNECGQVAQDDKCCQEAK